MRLLRQLADEVEAEQAAQGPAYHPPPQAAQAQSAELLAQPPPQHLSPAEAQAAELNGLAQPDEAYALPQFMVDLLSGPEADEVLGPVPESLAPPTLEAIERVRRLLDEPMPGPAAPNPAAWSPSLPTVFEVPEVERDPMVPSEANHPVSRGPAARAPGLPTIAEVPEVERDPAVPSEANHPTPRRAPRHRPALETIDEHARPEVREPRRARVAQAVDDMVGPGVAASAQGPGDAVAHVLGMPHLERADADQFGEQAAAFGTGMGITGGLASTVGAAARVYNGQHNLRAGRDKVSNAADESERRAGAAQVRGALADLGQGSNALAGSGTGVGATIAELAGATAPAAVGLAGGVMGGVGGAAAMARHGRKGNRALRRYRALHRLKETISDPELKAVRAYAAKKNAKAAVLQSGQSLGGGVGMAAGIAVAASAATPVGWALGATAAGIGLGAAGYMAGRKLYKDHHVRPRREAQGLDPDKRRAMAVKLQEKLGDGDPAVRGEAEALVAALGLTVEQALGADGIDLLKKKMRTA